ncbi:MAG: carboxypeptidase regulatory-like domain-containing protein, partial [Proteobacteria bacterium]|nr:carboxypeptidase regulatory-like domain-containing protein [Pseudomonadota bacterium]
LDRGWSQPRCAEVCPTQAILFGDLDDPASDIARQAAAGALEELRPQLNSGARVRYRHLPAPFLSGEVVLADQPDLPAPGVRIELDDGSRRFETRSDNYGEFRFPAIKPRQRYRVRIEHPGYASLEISVAPHAPKDLGALMLQRGGP